VESPCRGEEQGLFPLETMYSSKESHRDTERGDSWFEEVESYSVGVFFQLIKKRL